MQELKARMSRQEFLAWIEFYKLFPFDDRHRYHRPAALIASTAGADLEKAMDWLQPLAKTHDYSDADLNTLRAFGFSAPKRMAKE